MEAYVPTVSVRPQVEKPSLDPADDEFQRTHGMSTKYSDWELVKRLAVFAIPIFGFIAFYFEIQRFEKEQAKLSIAEQTLKSLNYPEQVPNQLRIEQPNFRQDHAISIGDSTEVWTLNDVLRAKASLYKKLEQTQMVFMAAMVLAIPLLMALELVFLPEIVVLAIAIQCSISLSIIPAAVLLGYMKLSARIKKIDHLHYHNDVFLDPARYMGRSKFETMLFVATKACLQVIPMLGVLSHIASTRALSTQFDLAGPRLKLEILKERNLDLISYGLSNWAYLALSIDAWFMMTPFWDWLFENVCTAFEMVVIPLGCVLPFLQAMQNQSTIESMQRDLDLCTRDLEAFSTEPVYR